MRLLSLEQCIEKFKSAHGEKYDYSQVTYVNNCTKVKIICPTHGSFMQTPNAHEAGIGCRKCGYNKLRFWTEEKDTFLKNFYTKEGGPFCAQRLGVTLVAIHARARGMGLKRIKPRQETHNFPSNLWRRILRSVEDGKYEMNIDKDYRWSVFQNQGRKCALTGWNISFEQKERSCAASVDRINSDLGYIKGNIQIVDKRVNSLKSDFDEKFFYKMCKAVTKYRAHDLDVLEDFSPPL